MEFPDTVKDGKYLSGKFPSRSKNDGDGTIKSTYFFCIDVLQNGDDERQGLATARLSLNNDIPA